MVDFELQALTLEQLQQLQRQYLKAKFYGSDATIIDQSLESDGRKRGRVLKEAVGAGLLISTSESAQLGTRYQISADVIGLITPATPDLFEVWAALRDMNAHREAYERPWIRVEDLSIEHQCGLLESADIEWYVVSTSPYDYRSAFADEPETTVPDGRGSQSYNQYWAGPFSTLEDAIARRKMIWGSCIAASSRVLRERVAEHFAEKKLQWGFANNLLWGLVDLGIVPEDTVFDADGKPKVDSQLDEGYSLQLSSNPNAPQNREAVEWETNLSKSIDRWKARIAKAEQQLEILRMIQTRITSYGGWGVFMDGLESRLRSVGTENSRRPDEGSSSE